MTYTDDFAPVEDVDALEAPSYPVAFGIELTPKIQGIAIAILGLAGAFFLYTRLVQPLQQQKTEAEQRVADKENIFRNQAESLERVEAVEAERDSALAVRAGVYSLLGDQNSLDTLLLDLNQQIERSNAQIQETIIEDSERLEELLVAVAPFTEEQVERNISERASNQIIQEVLYNSKLSQFNPVGLSGPVGDDFGPELNSKLERQIVEVEFEALFEQTQNILANLERLEPLLLIRDFNQSLAPLPGNLSEEEFQFFGVSRRLNTAFTMEVLVPIGDPQELPTVPDPAEAAEGEAAEGETAEGEAAE